MFSPPGKLFIYFLLVLFDIWRANCYRYLFLMGACENAAAGRNYTSCCVKLNLQTVWFVLNWPLLSTNSTRATRPLYRSMGAEIFHETPRRSLTLNLLITDIMRTLICSLENSCFVSDFIYFEYSVSLIWYWWCSIDFRRLQTPKLHILKH